MKNYLDLRNETDYTKLKEAARIIKQGGIVVFPTETVYGIGVNCFDEKAVRKLYEIKQRQLDKPISLLVSNMKMVNKIAKDITEMEYKMMKKFFPGPLTMILKKRNIIPDVVTSKQDTVGVRMPSDRIALKLIEYANVPIATTSANISGNPSETNLESIIKCFEGKVDYFVDGGESEIGLASTIVQMVDEIPNILRQGSITAEQIGNAMRDLE